MICFDNPGVSNGFLKEIDSKPARPVDFTDCAWTVWRDGKRNCRGVDRYWTGQTRTCGQSRFASSPDSTDALESLRIGVAATRSLREGRPVKIAEVGAKQADKS
jgi:hypothetical protein